MSLQNLQAEFAEIILNNETKTELVKPAACISIYHQHFFATLTQTLKDTYPLVEKLVGIDFFQVAAKHYISQYPSTSGDLHHYGEYFSDFLKEFPPIKSLYYLSEVAQFEWACHLVYFAADHAGLDLDKLQTISPADYANLHLHLHPATAVVRFHYPMLQIIDLCHERIEGPINIDGDGILLLIKRHADDIIFHVLSEAEFVFLSALQNDASLIEALNAAEAIDTQFKLEEKLPHWVKETIIVELDLPHAHA